MAGGPSVTDSIRCAALSVLCGALLSSAAAAQSAPADPGGASVAAVTGNPAATTVTTGTGQLGRWLGLRDEWGVRLGGVWLAEGTD